MDTDRRTFMPKVAPILVMAAGFHVIPTIALADDGPLDERGIQERMEYVESIPNSVLRGRASFDTWQGSDLSVSAVATECFGVDL